MVSSIDITKPIYGTPTTQSVRDNFHIARDEITALQDTSSGFVNRSGDKMTGMLTLVGPPVNQNDAATLDWTLRQLHSSVNTLVFIGDYDGANDIILSSGQPQFVVGQPLPAASPLTTQYYFVVKTSHAAPGIGNQPAEGVTQGTFLISNGVGWINFAMTAAEVIAQTVPVAPPITNVPGANVYDALAGIGQNFLLKTGGTLTGDLVLNRNPVVPMGAATKQFVESLIGGSPNEAPQDGFGYVRSNAAWSNLPKFNKVAIDSNTWGHLTLNSSVASATANQILGFKDNVVRWAFNIGNSFPGADLDIWRYNDTGTAYDGAPVFAINRGTGNITIKHHLYLDPLVGAVAWIYGRGPNNPTDALSDTLNIWARSGVGSSVIGLRGPSYTPNPNGVEIYTGASTNFAWKFDQNGTLTTPGNIALGEAKAVWFADAYILKTGGSLIFNGDANWRMWFSSSNGYWTWDGYPNFQTKMQLNNISGDLCGLTDNFLLAAMELHTGDLVITLMLSVGTVNLIVMSMELMLAMLHGKVGVNTNFATYSWVNTYFLPFSGGTITSALTVNGRLRTADALMIASGVIYVADNLEYYLARNTNDGYWRFVEGNVVNLTIQPGGDLYARGGLFGGSPWGTLGIYRGGLGIVQQFAPDWYWEWDANGGGSLQWVAGAGRVFWVYRMDWLAYNNMGPVGGHGWMELSDTRTKTNVTLMEDIGLKELMHINPIRFQSRKT